MRATDVIWRAAARTLARTLGRPAALQWLARHATPYYNIHGADGTLYMRRWWLLPRWCLRFDAVRGYPVPKAWMPFSVRLHHIVEPDQDRHLHDHPFNFRSVVLSGWYVEQCLFGQLDERAAAQVDGVADDLYGTRAIRHLKAGDTYRSAAGRMHRIDGVSEGGAWSLFVMGRRVQDWGFLVDGRKVAWRDYLDGGAPS